jgi:hypothetical protein
MAMVMSWWVVGEKIKRKEKEAKKQISASIQNIIKERT